jgi:hypothetical protein
MTAIATILDAGLTLAERVRLVEIERGIDAERATIRTSFVQIGALLRQIRDENLWCGDYRSFADYVSRRWQFSDRRARQLIDAAQVGTMVPVSNERVARELTPVLRDGGEAAVLDVYRELRAEHGDQVTAAVVRETVERKLSRGKIRATRPAANGTGRDLGGNAAEPEQAEPPPGDVVAIREGTNGVCPTCHGSGRVAGTTSTSRRALGA